jgi:choline-glycine betaine transporter
VLTVCFIASAVSGVAKGIQWLSNINMVLAVVLALFVFVVGPTVLILNLVPTALGDYARESAEMASRTDASGHGAMAAWLSSWTVFYWAWWISWTPFVGMFIARISRGRTIREFVTGVLIVPSLVSLVWFAIFGGAAIDALRGGADLNPNAFDTALFQLLGEYPLAGVTTVLVMILVGIFFVSGADAASIVMGTLSEKGKTEPSCPTVIFWGVLTGGVAAVMLLAGGGSALTGLQNITIAAALPFVLVMIGLSVSLSKDLRNDPLMLRTERASEMVEQAVITGVQEHGDDFSLVVCGDSSQLSPDAAPHRRPPAAEPADAEPMVAMDNRSNG